MGLLLSMESSCALVAGVEDGVLDETQLSSARDGGDELASTLGNDGGALGANDATALSVASFCSKNASLYLCADFDEGETSPIFEKGVTASWSDADKIGEARESVVASSFASAPAAWEVSVKATEQPGDPMSRLFRRRSLVSTFTGIDVDLDLILSSSSAPSESTRVAFDLFGIEFSSGTKAYVLSLALAPLVGSEEYGASLLERGYNVTSGEIAYPTGAHVKVGKGAHARLSIRIARYAPTTLLVTLSVDGGSSSFYLQPPFLSDGSLRVGASARLKESELVVRYDNLAAVLP